MRGEVSRNASVGNALSQAEHFLLESAGKMSLNPVSLNAENP